ncbi:MAG: penicillin-binding protein 2 [Patescibacteria group bacterium]
MRDGSRTRIKLVGILIFLFGLALLGRLFYLQIIKHDYYSDKANAQYIGKSPQMFNRGDIYFKKKDGQLISGATIKNGFLVALIPKQITNPEDVYNKISKIIDVDRENFFKKINKKNDPYEEIAHRLNEDEKKEIEKLNIDGLRLYPESWRYYPAKNLAANVIGFVGFKDNDLLGRYGIEYKYDEVLKGENGNNNVNFFAEILSKIKKELKGGGNESGSVVLSIDPVVQSFLENTIQKNFDNLKAEQAGGLIIDPKTGRIIAMAIKPDFDPNNYSKVKDQSLFVNPMVENIFEMGSIMKPLTIAAAIDQNKITPQTTYFDKGYVDIDSRRLNNFDKKGRGKVDMQEVLNQSLNTGAVFAEQQLGHEKFREYIKNYGFGSKTEIDLPGEIAGRISTLESKRDVEFATASFGQNIAVTPIAMIIALSSLANGGFIVRPHVVDEIKYENGDIVKTEPKIIKQVLKKETTEILSGMLSKVYDSILGGQFKIDHYSVSAKTGTAQMTKDGKYLEGDQNLHTFFGYAPSYNPKFLTFLFLINPQGVRFASVSLTPPFSDITKFLINYYEIPPDR